MRFLAKVHVTLKPGVLDPQGKAVGGALRNLGYAEVGEVRIGKYIEVTLEAESQELAQAQVREMAERLLANPVLEKYRVEVVPAP